MATENVSEINEVAEGADKKTASRKKHDVYADIEKNELPTSIIKVLSRTDNNHDVSIARQMEIHELETPKLKILFVQSLKLAMSSESKVERIFYVEINKVAAEIYHERTLGIYLDPHKNDELEEKLDKPLKASEIAGVILDRIKDNLLGNEVGENLITQKIGYISDVINKLLIASTDLSTLDIDTLIESGTRMFIANFVNNAA